MDKINEVDLHQEGRTELAEKLTDAIDLASDQDQSTWITDGSKRVAGIVPVDVLEAHQAGLDEITAFWRAHHG